MCRAWNTLSFAFGTRISRVSLKRTRLLCVAWKVDGTIPPFGFGHPLYLFKGDCGIDVLLQKDILASNLDKRVYLLWPLG